MLTFRNDTGTLVRPGFESIEQHDEYIIDQWNSVVKPSDHVYHLGDVAMRKDVMEWVTPCLNGHKRLLRGNHDIFKTKDYINAGWKEIHGCRVIGIPRVVLTHIPIHPDSMVRFLGNIHGHTHSAPDLEGSYLNICAERINYTPITLEEAQARLHVKEAQR
jgi:calcineurin-like phosphoesterase family protein